MTLDFYIIISTLHILYETLRWKGDHLDMVYDLERKKKDCIHSVEEAVVLNLDRQEQTN